MSEINLKIDGKDVKAEAGMTVLEAARKAGIDIPTLCHHEKLEAYGGCRLCMVEVESRGWTSHVVSCTYPVAKDIVVRTRSEKVDKIRRVLIEELMAHVKILVPVKRVIDYNVKVRVKADGTGVDLANVKMSMNPFDEIAVEEAMRLKEAGKATEVVAVSCGVTACQETLRTAMAIGADRGHPGRDRRRTAAAGRGQAARRRGEEGSAATHHPRQAGDRRRRQPDRPDAGRAAGLVAGHLRLQGRDRRRQGHGDPRSRRRPGNPRDQLPAIVTTDLRLNEPRYATLPNIMKAKKKPLEVVKPADLGVDVAPRLATVKRHRTAQAQRRHQGRRHRATGRQTQERSQGDLMRMSPTGRKEAASRHRRTRQRQPQGRHPQCRHRRRQDRWRDPHPGRRCNCGAVAEQAAKVAGVAKVKVADAAHYGDQTAENLAALIVANAGYSHILAPATSNGKNTLPRVAALLDVAQISEIISVVDADTFVRPIYAGNALATVKSADATKVITVRTTGFDAAAPTRAAVPRSRHGGRCRSWASRSCSAAS
jgi:hypothetical protein